MQLFKDKVALVTGSTGEGMGRSIALTLGREAARVVLNYGTGHPNNVLAAEKVLQEIRTLGGKGYAFKADTREEDEVKRMVEGVMRLYGQIDYLICNAGGPWEMKDIVEIDQEHWRSVIKAEIDGLFYCVKHVLPQFGVVRQNLNSLVASVQSLQVAEKEDFQSAVDELMETADSLPEDSSVSDSLQALKQPVEDVLSAAKNLHTGLQCKNNMPKPGE